MRKKSGWASRFFQKEEPEWDDGASDSNAGDAKGHPIFFITGAYGAASGFLACQYCKYLHQRFACLAWGVPFSSQPVPSYGIPNMLADIISVFCIYALAGAVGMLLNRGIQWFRKEQDEKEIYNNALGFGFFLLIVLSIIALILPFNFFMIGV